MTMANMGRYSKEKENQIHKLIKSVEWERLLFVCLFEHMICEGFTPVGLESGPDMS